MSAMFGEAVRRDGVRLLIRASLPRMFLLALGAGLFVALGILMGYLSLLGLYHGLVRKEIPIFLVTSLVQLPMLALALASVLFFGIALIHALHRLVFFWRPVLTVGPQGVYDAASVLGAGLVPWHEISHVRVMSYGGQEYLGLRLKGSAKVLARQNPIKRRVMIINRDRFTGTLVNIPQIYLPISVHTLSREVKAYRRLYSTG